MDRTVGGRFRHVCSGLSQVRATSAASRHAAAESSQSCDEHVLSRREVLRTVAGMSTDLRHRLGRAGEDLALRHLERRGYRLVARNHRTRFGEIDLIVADGETLVFCEVKSRRLGSGSPWDALGAPKQQQVRQMALAYLSETPDRPARQELRFDAVGVIFDGRGRLARLDHIEGAF